MIAEATSRFNSYEIATIHCWRALDTNVTFKFDDTVAVVVLKFSLSKISEFMSCPFKASEEVAPSTAGKCPHLAAQQQQQTETSATASACPHVGAQKEGGDVGRCPYRAQQDMEQEKNGAAPWKASEGDKDWRTATTEEFKAHFQQAYNTVATDVAARQQHHAATSGVEIARKNTIVAKLLMERLGYTQAELEIVGDDVWLMQGTGNPHTFAKIQPGETVVDLGSGFGLDALVAASKVGGSGRVIGIDLAIQEVANALQRVHQRRLAAAAANPDPAVMTPLQQQLNVVDFRHGDIERPPLNDGTVDVCISNGGFCLVPDKPKSFREIFRMLKPGGNGRMSISCTARRKALDLTKNWPSCMLVFIPLDEAKSMLESIGFVDVVVDTTGGRMEVWDEVKRELAGETEEKPLPECPHMRKQEVEKRAKVAATTSAMLKEDKVTIHTGGNESKYGFLDDMDMNEFFVRVTIFARKP